MIKLKKPLALLGLRGAGKTTLGRELSNSLNVPFVDMDSILVEESGVSIPQWIINEGWDNFRDAEADLLKRISCRKPCVVSTGGGVITQEKSVKLLRNSFLSVYLHWSPSILYERIARDANRPNLKETLSMEEEVDVMYAERNPIYKSCAHELKLKKDTSVYKSLSDILDIVYRLNYPIEG